MERGILYNGEKKNPSLVENGNVRISAFLNSEITKTPFPAVPHHPMIIDHQIISLLPAKRQQESAVEVDITELVQLH